MVYIYKNEILLSCKKWGNLASENMDGLEDIMLSEICQTVKVLYGLTYMDFKPNTKCIET